jgi:hypothetical protein
MRSEQIAGWSSIECKPIRARAHYVALSAATPSPIHTWRTAISEGTPLPEQQPSLAPVKSSLMTSGNRGQVKRHVHARMHARRCAPPPPALVGDGDCCCWMQWCSSSRCFSSRGDHPCWLAEVAAAGEGSSARRAGASLRGEHRLWLAVVTAAVG